MPPASSSQPRAIAGDKVCNPNAQSIWVEVDGRHYEIPAGKTVALV